MDEFQKVDIEPGIQKWSRDAYKDGCYKCLDCPNLVFYYIWKAQAHRQKHHGTCDAPAPAPVAGTSAATMPPQAGTSSASKDVPDDFTDMERILKEEVEEIIKKRTHFKGGGPIQITTLQHPSFLTNILVLGHIEGMTEESLGDLLVKLGFMVKTIPGGCFVMMSKPEQAKSKPEQPKSKPEQPKSKPEQKEPVVYREEVYEIPTPDQAVNEKFNRLMDTNSDAGIQFMQQVCSKKPS